MAVLRALARRLLLQALISGTVMAGIQGVTRFGPDLLAPSAEAPAQVGATMPPSRAEARPAFAQDRTPAGIKVGRLPVWREQTAAPATITPERLASKGAGTGLSDVMLFDRCRPDCESRDPLLAFNRDRTPAPVPFAAPALPPQSIDTWDPSSAPNVSGHGFGVAAAARKGATWARGLMGSAGSAVGW